MSQDPCVVCGGFVGDGNEHQEPPTEQESLQGCPLGHAVKLVCRHKNHDKFFACESWHKWKAIPGIIQGKCEKCGTETTVYATERKDPPSMHPTLVHYRCAICEPALPALHMRP
jgi:hypothetical protein